MEGRDADAPDRAGWIKTNQGVAFCVAVVAMLLLLYLATSEWAYRVLRDGFRLGAFTAVATVATLLCAVAMMFDSHRHETDPDIARSSWKDWAIAASAMVLCYIYFELAWRVDFLIVTPLFLTGATYLLGARPLRSAILAAVLITAVLYGLFYVIGIDLPSELLGL